MMYSREYNITFPPLNVPLMLFQFVRQLTLPCKTTSHLISQRSCFLTTVYLVEIYASVRKLQQILGFSFQFPLEKRTSTRSLSFPEAQLLALIVVATKLMFPFSKTKGFPISATEPAAQVLDWNVWTAAQKHYEKKSKDKGRLAKGQEVMVNDGHVFHLTGQQMDDYLDWYENTWIDKNRGK